MMVSLLSIFLLRPESNPVSPAGRCSRQWTARTFTLVIYPWCTGTPARQRFVYSGATPCRNAAWRPVSFGSIVMKFKGGDPRSNSQTDRSCLLQGFPDTSACCYFTFRKRQTLDYPMPAFCRLTQQTFMPHPPASGRHICSMCPLPPAHPFYSSSTVGLSPERRVPRPPRSARTQSTAPKTRRAHPWARLGEPENIRRRDP